MNVLDFLPIVGATLIFACFFAFFHFKKKKAVGKQTEYQEFRGEFFNHLPTEEILTPEDCKIIKDLLKESAPSKDTPESVYIILSKNIIQENAHANQEVQYQLKVFLEKVIPIIENIDDEDEGKHVIVTECRQLFQLYANAETKSIFKGTKFLHLKH
jgi:hypothetical protein